jgi:Fic family protein
VETETDGGDTTYFVIHQLGVIERAISDLHLYLQRKIAQMRDVESLLLDDTDLNGRQLALLTNAVRHPGNAYSFESHGRSHRVSHETARTDLGHLAERGLLTKRRRGHRFIFEPTPELERRLKESPR